MNLLSQKNAGSVGVVHRDGQTELIDGVDRALAASTDWFLKRQHADGHWCGELEGDTILESEYILLLAWLGHERGSTARKAASYILTKQNEAGGWSLYPDGPIDISVSVKAYFALKLTGHDPDEDHMRRARAVIRANGGADAVNSFTRFYLALLGQISYQHCPAVPPEMILLPNWSPINIYRISAWSRTIFVPLSIVWANHPSRTIDDAGSIRELFLEEPNKWRPLCCPGKENASSLWSWQGFFRSVDSGLKLAERCCIRPLRRRAVKQAEAWMLERFQDSDGLGAIFPPIIWSVIALRCLGYSEDSPEVQECLNQLEALMIDEDDAIRLQPCKSPVWDTAIALRALSAAKHMPEDSVAGCVDWLLAKEVRVPGDWEKTVKAEPAGWFFEHENAFYPDIDDTIMVMMALREASLSGSLATASEERVGVRGSSSPTPADGREHAEPSPGLRTCFEMHKRLYDGLPRPSTYQHSDPTTALEGHRTSISKHVLRVRLSKRERSGGEEMTSKIDVACERALQWILAMQNRDGGWGAFDKDNDLEFLCHVPFADHNAMIDPSTPDITARVLEALAQFNMSVGHPAVDRAVSYICRTQEEDGAWFGRWGVNYIYGTWQVLSGLAQIGVPTNDPAIQRGVAWLLEHQQTCGGWGESARTYDEPETRGLGAVTASQTAWALLGLIDAGLADHPAVEKGARYLVDHQEADGSWHETEFTGTGFPRVFYLRYHMYPMYFPLLALARFRTARGSRAFD